MPLVVGVAFKPATKVYFFDPNGNVDLCVWDYVVVDTARGRTLGRVVHAPYEVSAAEISGALKPVLRRATPIDLVQADQATHREPETLSLCRERAAVHRLDMKVVRVEYNYDGSSLVVYFTSEGRIDFRNLVHDLAQTLRTRVEMRQIGVRDEAKFLDGHGRCGIRLCCSSWLREFTPVSIKMAKQQDLPLNPAEISGACGRLLCCLSYENEYYAEARQHLPRLNSTMETPEGPGRVKQIHVLRGTVTVLVEGPNESKSWVEVPIVDLEERMSAGCPGCPRHDVLASPVDLEAMEPDGEEVSPELAELQDSNQAGSAGDTRPRHPRTRRRGRHNAGQGEG